MKWVFWNFIFVNYSNIINVNFFFNEIRMKMYVICLLLLKIRYIKYIKFFFLLFLKEFKVSREYKIICYFKKNVIVRIIELKRFVLGNDIFMLFFLVVFVFFKYYWLNILYMK